MTQNKKQKQTLQLSNQQPRAKQKLRIWLQKKKEEIQVRQTRPICTNDRNSRISHNHHDIAPQNKNKALHGRRKISRNANKCITSSSSFNHDHHYRRHLYDHNCDIQTQPRSNFVSRQRWSAIPIWIMRQKADEKCMNASPHIHTYDSNQNETKQANIHKYVCNIMKQMVIHPHK